MTDKKIKKVCVIGCLPEILGGIERGGIASHIGELYTNLKNVNIDVIVFYNDKIKNKEKEVLSYRNKIDILKNSILGFLKFGKVKSKNYSIKEKIKILADANKIFRLKDDGVDIFHVHSLHNLANKACEIANVKFVSTDHAFWHVEYNKEKIIENIKSSTIIAISEISKEKIFALKGNNNIVKINNPINPIEFKLKNKNKNKNKFNVYFNGISDGWGRKGLSYISKEILDICSIDNIHITIVTDENSRNTLISINPWIVGSEKVTVSEPLSRYDNLLLLANSDVFLAPSLSEGFSIAYLESVMLSVPVIGFGPNIEEINSMLKTDFCIAFDHDNDSIYDKLLEIKNRDNIKINQKLFLWKNNIDKYIKVYEKVLNEE